MPEPTNSTIHLHDGRILGYAQYGISQGSALFYFHGFPGSRFEARFLAAQAQQMGICLIGVDRPGLGLSTYKAGRRVLDWPDDVVELADYLHIDRFSVVGFSGGSPYALACAYKIPGRLVACGLVSGVGHVNRFQSFLSQWLPWIFFPITKRFFKDEMQAQQTLERFASRWAESDQRSLLQPGIKELMAASLAEAFRQGAKGAAYDGTLLGGSWGFNLAEVGFPAVYLWHGELDTESPVTTVRALVKDIPHFKATYYRHDSHISLIVNHKEEIVRTLMTLRSG